MCKMCTLVLKTNGLTFFSYSFESDLTSFAFSLYFPFEISNFLKSKTDQHM